MWACVCTRVYLHAHARVCAVGWVGKREDLLIFTKLLFLSTQTEMSVLGSSVCLCSSHISHQDTDSNKHSPAGKRVCGSLCVVMLVYKI